MEIFLIYYMQGTIAFKTHIMDLEWITFLKSKSRFDALKYYFTHTHIKYNKMSLMIMIYSFDKKVVMQ